MIRIKTRGQLIELNENQIVTLKATQIGSDEYVAVIETADYKVITLDLDGTPFATKQECITSATNYIEQGGEQ